MKTRQADLPENAAPCPREADAAASALGALPEAEQAAVARHAASCPRCAHALARGRAVAARLRAAPDTPCRTDFTDQVMARLPVAAATPFRPAFWPALARIAAGLLVLLGAAGAFLLVRDGSRPDAPGPDPLADAAQTPGAAHTPDPAADARAGARAWLLAAQSDDGGWRAATGNAAELYDVGVSALALLALMESDPARLDAASRAAIRRGLDYLAARQDADGLFGPSCPGAPYNQGLATLAMLEARALEDDPGWQAAARRGLAFLRAIQDPEGGWGYYGSSPGSVNSSVSIWPLIALVRGDQAGFAGLDLRPAIDGGRAWLRATVGDGGLMGYHRANESPYGFATLTAAGAVCLLRTGHPADRRVADTMLPAIRRAAADPNLPMDLYRTFFVSEALALAGADAGPDRLTESVSGNVASAQVRAGPDAGSWEPRDAWSGIGGPVCATALASLSVARH